MSKSSIRILIIFNQYLVGGRETYIQEYVRALKKQGECEAYLLCGRFGGDGRAFDHVVEVASNEEHFKDIDISAWYRGAETLLQGKQPDLVWVQHYEVLPAMWLAEKYSTKLLITLHGSLTGLGSLPEFDRIALEIAVKCKATLSVVSRELEKQTLVVFPRSEPPLLLPNLISVDRERTQMNAVPLQNIQRIVMLSRRQKQDHLKAGVQLAAHLLRQGLNPYLSVYVEKFGDQKSPKNGDIRLRDLFGKRWIIKNPKLWPMLRRTRVYSSTHNVREVIREHDLVFGMGRVVIEGIAEHKPSVLIGYEQAIGLIDLNRFEEYSYSNFSGRGLKADSLMRIAKSIRQLWQGDKKIDFSGELIEHVDISFQAQRLYQYVLKDHASMTCPESLPTLEITDQANLIAILVNDKNRSASNGNNAD